MDDKKKHFIVFGNSRFIKSRERIIDEASELNIFYNLNFETEDICEEEAFKKVIENYNKNNPRKHNTGKGFYFYMWKPYVIYKNLLKLKDGDILFYTDSGMAIINNNNTINKFNNLFNLVINKDLCPSGIATFITTGHPENRKEIQWNRKEVFRYFKVLDNDEIKYSQQVQAGVNMIEKNDISLKIVKEWFDLTLSNPELFIGDRRFSRIINNEAQYPEFKAHRHDQSVWSILCKLNNVNILTHNKNPMKQCHQRE
tara:strand:+ start:16584 stop:17351 length:768 start_codon:yes stop_codon:yes gene_type:complete